jgi:hypothetical protein
MEGDREKPPMVNGKGHKGLGIDREKSPSMVHKVKAWK